MLTPEEKRELLRIAREAIAAALQGKSQRRGSTPSGGLASPSGAFVTLRLGHELRGCIGYIESAEPVADVVAEVAVRAAFEDPRFPPVTPAEFRKISLEVSVLSPMRRVGDISEIEVGVHGLVIERGGRRGLLLPQVAVEFGWDRMEFLANVCRKAGLPREAWMGPGAALYVFSAELAAEEDVLIGPHHS